MKIYVHIREKSEWQKDNCLFCNEKATLEAVTAHVFIRSCANTKCIAKATRIARVTEEAFS